MGIGRTPAVALLVAAALAAAAPDAGAAETPTAAFDAAPLRPSAGSPVTFRNRSVGEFSGWSWTFGDGEASSEKEPAHVFAQPGDYPVTLRALRGGAVAETTTLVSIAAADTLVLLAGAGHAFEITLTATDPRTHHTGAGEAVSQNDVFGYFRVPDLVPTAPGSPFVPEVFVKMLDARTISGQDFWFFWGGLTDLTYELTVRDTVRGTVKVYGNPVTGNPTCLGADTSGFADPFATPTTTPTAGSATATPTRTPSPTGSRTPTGPAPTSTPTRTTTPTATITPTQTPTVPAVVDVVLEARPYQWDFLAGPEISSNPKWPGQNQVVLRVGQTYRFDVFNGSPDLDPPLPSHTFSGVSGLGLSGGAFTPGQHLPPKTVTITGAMVGTYTYSCIDSACGSSAQHDQMGGRIVVSN
jgi:PKD repeat protein